MIENGKFELSALFDTDEFSHIKTHIKEIEHCLSLEEKDISRMSTKEKEYVESVLMRHRIFFDGQKTLLLAKTPTKLFEKDNLIQTKEAATAYHNADWKALLKDFNFELELPSKLVCIEHLFETPFPITNDFGMVTWKMKGVIVFAKQTMFDGKNAILVDICSLCSPQGDADNLKIYSTTAHFLLAQDEHDDFTCLATEKGVSDWVTLSVNTAENLSFMQVIILIILFKTNKSELCESKLFNL